MTPEQRYEDLIEEFLGEDGVLPPPGGSGFGRGQLVVKLPRKRVDELVAGGTASGSTPTRELR